MYSNSASKKSSVVKSCKFCKDSGKSYDVYSSHFVRETRDPSSRIVCPTILAMECKYCFKKGHTISKCVKYANRSSVITDTPIKKSKVDVNMNFYKKNAFELLSDSEEDEKSENTDDTVSSDISSNNSKLSYADMLKKEPVVKIIVNTKENVVNDFKALFKTNRIITNWADDFDSDEE